MDLEKLVNQTVIHKSFGKGIIRSVDEKYLEVDFVETGKVSKFPYPGCFHGFLTIEDSSLYIVAQLSRQKSNRPVLRKQAVT